MHMKLIIVAVAAAAMLGACGGSDAGRADVIARGDAACAEAAGKLDPIFGELFPTGSETPEAKVAAEPMSQAAAIIREEANVFAGLATDDAAFTPIREGVDRVADTIELSATKARAGDTDGYLQALEQANEVDAETREDMKAYGFTTCAGED
jgi:hypothetical protein